MTQKKRRTPKKSVKFRVEHEMNNKTVRSFFRAHSPADQRCLMGLITSTKEASFPGSIEKEKIANETKLLETDSENNLTASISHPRLSATSFVHNFGAKLSQPKNTTKEKKSTLQLPHPYVITENENIGGQIYAHPSKSVSYGVYELMQMLTRSMTVGCQISPTFYVPRSIWFQTDIKFNSVSIKMGSFELLNLALMEVRKLDLSEFEKFEKGVVAFRVTIEEVQNTLSNHISFVHPVKKSVNEEKKPPSPTAGRGKGMLKWKAGVRRVIKTGIRAASAGTKDIESDLYLQYLRDILEQSIIFHTWITDIDSIDGKSHNWDKKMKDEIRHHFEKIGHFFFSVVCNIIIYDMKSATKRFMKSTTKRYISGAG